MDLSSSFTVLLGKKLLITYFGGEEGSGGKCFSFNQGILLSIKFSFSYIRAPAVQRQNFFFLSALWELMINRGPTTRGRSRMPRLQRLVERGDPAESNPVNPL